MNLLLGTAISFSEINLPFSVNDFLGSGMNVFGFVATFVLLGLSFKFVPMLIEIIKDSFITYNHYRTRYPNDSEWYGGKKPGKVQLYRKSLSKTMQYRKERDY